MHTGFWLVNLREREHLENPGVEGRITGTGMLVLGLDLSGSG